MNQYRNFQFLSQGGMAEVFRAEFETVGFTKPVVIKKILKSHDQNHHWVDSFLNEAKIMSMLTHSNIVQVSDFGKLKDRYFLAMEYVDGGSVRDLLNALEKNHPISEPLCLFVMMEVLKGLSFAHQKGILHRDISPSNILISKEGEVKLTDFGIAKRQSESLETTQFLKGKASYMSPEQRDKKSLTPASDLYSVGVVLLEMLKREDGPGSSNRSSAYLDCFLNLDPSHRVQSCEEAEVLLWERLKQLNTCVTWRDLSEFVKHVSPWKREPKTSVLSDCGDLKNSMQPSYVIFGTLRRYIQSLRWAAGIIFLFMGMSSPSFLSQGYLSLSVSPWANVYMKKHFLGVTPLVHEGLPSGHYVLEVTNPLLNKSQTVDVILKANELKTILVTF